MGGASAGAALGRWIRQYPNGQLYAYIIAGLIFFGFIAYIVWNERRLKHVASAGKFRLVTLMADTDAAHLLHESVPDPSGIRSRLKAFDTAEAVYDYLYRRYDEPLYKRLLLHRPGSEPVEFVPDKDKSHDENLAGLSEQLG